MWIVGALVQWSASTWNTGKQVTHQLAGDGGVCYAVLSNDPSTLAATGPRLGNASVLRLLLTAGSNYYFQVFHTDTGNRTILGSKDYPKTFYWATYDGDQ
jgi:hypothetical protein